jgi:hypothetical protein
MTFFQNLFAEYEGSWGAGDEQGYSLNALRSSFKISGNQNSPEKYIAWNEGPYDLSVDGNLTIYFSLSRDYNTYYSFTVDVAGATASATTAFEVQDLLNADSSFSEWFTAIVISNRPNSEIKRVAIVPKKAVTELHFYIPNTGAENVLRFNKKAGVADVPSPLEKDTIENRFLTGSLGQLIRLSHTIESNTAAAETEITSTDHGLASDDVIYIVGSNSDPTIDGQHTISVTGDDTFVIGVSVTLAGTSGEWLSSIEQTIVQEAGLDYADMLLDWEHLRGEAKNYQFTKNTLDLSDRIIEQLIWPTGAKAGQTVKKVMYTYTGTATTPDTVIEIPYILQTADLISP